MLDELGVPRMHVVVFGNCQAGALSSILPRVLPGTTSTGLSNNTRTGGFAGQEQTLDQLKSADVVLFQPLDARHGLLSESSLRQELSGKPIVSFPYLFNSGLTTLAYAPLATKHSYGEIYGEDVVAARLAAAQSPEAILEDVAGGDALGAQDRHIASMTELRRREQTIDVKVADFVEHWLPQRFLFITHNHPTNVVMCEVVRQVLAKLQLSYDPVALAALEGQDNKLPCNGAPVTPADERRFGAAWGHHADWRAKCAHLIGLVKGRLDGEAPAPSVFSGLRFPAKDLQAA